ncbi:MAG TPA: hypothetical protein VG406_14775 [Isosphaeraceae bacterium]|jgi:hypothetical protein|nr:hypothetical protein [Isosphaeraceae bacterium]
MLKTRSSLNWRQPDWHPDFGDAAAEFEHLQALALAVLSTISGAEVELVVPEPGLMYLHVARPDGMTAEVYSLPGVGSASRRFGVFVSPGTDHERESYTDSVSQAIERIGTGHEMAPEAPRREATP